MTKKETKKSDNIVHLDVYRTVPIPMEIAVCFFKNGCVDEIDKWLVDEGFERDRMINFETGYIKGTTFEPVEIIGDVEDVLQYWFDSVMAGDDDIIMAACDQPHVSSELN